MARTRIKCGFLIYCLTVSCLARSLPLTQKQTSVTDEAYIPYYGEKNIHEDVVTTQEVNVHDTREVVNNITRNDVSNEQIILNTLRPGQEVTSYKVTLTRSDDGINGLAVIDVRLTDGDIIKFNAFGLNIGIVRAGVLTDANSLEANKNMNGDVLDIFPVQGPATSYVLTIEYTIPFNNDGNGIYLGQDIDGNEYMAMNLNPTNARRVFPCMDEPNLASMTTFTFNNMFFSTVLTNSELAPDSTTEFRSLEGPTHLWAMVAHNMSVISNPVPGQATLYARQGAQNQASQADVAISNYYEALNKWTDRNHNDIILNQNGGLHVVAVPDISRDWYGLSTLCIWEPYIMMENINAVMQRKTALVTLAEGMARQWYGYLVRPENWRFQWVTAGLGSYAAYEVAKNFQTPAEGQEDESLIDMNAIFTTDVIQESLLFDAYSNAQPLETENDLFDENAIRYHISGLLKTKAPALLRMVKIVLSEERDFVQAAAKALIRGRALQTVISRNLYEALQSESLGTGGSNLVFDVDGFLRPWVINSGYPVIIVTTQPGGVLITQRRFGFSIRPQILYSIPISFTTSQNPNFDNIQPIQMMGATATLSFGLGEEDWVILNLQGQGYYRVQYQDILWERIIAALSDPETREVIHPLNRASLLDDALNLARAGDIEYDVAFEMALTMEHETDYAVWKAFVRNMDFIKKRLMAFIAHDDEKDEDIYLRMIRRAIVAFEEEIGFEPESAAGPSMESLTRGLVMDHACRSGYEPCIAAAVDMFFDPNNDENVNPNIHPEIRPAVYCAMVREGEENVMEALERRLELQGLTRYERLVILESYACSEDDGFIGGLLAQTINANSPYLTEERSKIFAAVASSSYQNSGLALNFLIANVRGMRDAYGGPEKLEEMILVMAENIVDGGQAADFTRWVNSLNTISNLDDSIMVASRARERILENMVWVDERLPGVYEWIDENDAPTLLASTLLLGLCLFINLFNQH